MIKRRGIIFLFIKVNQDRVRESIFHNIYCVVSHLCMQIMTMDLLVWFNFLNSEIEDEGCTESEFFLRNH